MKKTAEKEKDEKMKETIYTIPVNEAFAQKSGCPLCRLRADLEQSAVERMVGPAMMEPDVRIETNEHGFCMKHMGLMREKNAVLPLGLLLDTYVERLQKEAAFHLSERDGAKRCRNAAEQLKKKNDDCYICSKIEGFFGEEVDTIFHLYKKEPDFRKAVSEQEYFCLPHLEMLLKAAPSKLFGKEASVFCSAVSAITGNYLKTLKGDLNWFCKKFDYGNKDKDWGNSKNSIERAIAVLRGK